MSRRTWRLIAFSVAAVVLTGCQSTVAGTGHFAADQTEPTTGTDPTDTPTGVDEDEDNDGEVPDLRGTATCVVDEPSTTMGGSALVSVELIGTGGHLDVTIELTGPPGQDRLQVVGFDVVDHDRLTLVVGATFAPGIPPQAGINHPDEGTTTNLTDPPLVSGTTVTFSVPADKLTDVGPAWQWIGINGFTETDADSCPPLSAGPDAEPIEFPSQ